MEGHLIDKDDMIVKRIPYTIAYETLILSS
jgi:hypothetical protein